MTTSSRSEIRVRITVRQPPRGVAFAVQHGRDALLEASTRSASALTFNFVFGVAPAVKGKSASLRGPYVQGPAGARFVYLTSGTRAGQPDSPWNRRAKLPLAGISPALIAAALRSPGGRLETAVDGRAPDGGPVYATIKGIEWQVTDSSRQSRQPSDER